MKSSVVIERNWSRIYANYLTILQCNFTFYDNYFDVFRIRRSIPMLCMCEIKDF